MPLPFDFKIKRFAKLPSTNTYAREQASLGAEEGMVYVAEHQTGGRGQFDRKWKSPPGKNLLFSLFLRPPLTPSRAPMMTQLVSRSIAQVLKSQYKITSTFKHPNDLLVNGKKICGVLVESSSSSPKKIDNAIIGIGLNVNQAPADVTPEPIAMKDILGKELNLKTLLKDLLAQLEKDLEELYAHPI